MTMIREKIVTMTDSNRQNTSSKTTGYHQPSEEHNHENKPKAVVLIMHQVKWHLLETNISSSILLRK